MEPETITTEMNVANIGVFWNMDDNPIPDGLDFTTVKEYIKGAFEDMGYLGRLIKVRGYCEDRSELVSYCDAAGIFLQNRDTKGNTGIFWSIEDCPIPSGLDPLTFFSYVKKVLWGRNVSVMAYCDQNRSLDDFSLNDNLHITLPINMRGLRRCLRTFFLWALENPESNVLVITKSIPFHISYVIDDALSSRNYNLVLADPHAVGYVNSVWISTSLFGGGNPIDPSGRKNLPSSQETHNNRVQGERQKRERKEKEEKTRQAISRLVLEDQTELDRADILWETSPVSGLEIHRRDLDFNGWIFCCLGFRKSGRHSSSAVQSWVFGKSDGEIFSS
ncbi:hypothetical protein F2Q70_00026801 [Brassica cretica]|uniref:NYN domain-containing protein n=1 Tax=Brassica cretica TaxID=69181 RepID=A0A8S9LHD6_BRACR|nr:hypothetical protein F2Q70_00026801 [Brassica cretica]